MALSEKAQVLHDQYLDQAQRVFCKDCLFFDRMLRGQTNLGYCHIGAPIIIPQTSSKTGHWPIVEENSWCGEAIKKV